MSTKTAICPECDARLRFKQAVAEGTKVRCTQCRSLFRVGSEEEDLPPPRRGKESRRGSSSRVGLFLGLGVVLLLLLAGGVVAVVLATRNGSDPVTPRQPAKDGVAVTPGKKQSDPPTGGGKRPLPPAGGSGGTPAPAPAVKVDPARVSKDNFYKVRAGFLRDELDAILGPGAPSSEAQMRSVEEPLRGRVNAGIALGSLRTSATETLYNWPGNDRHVWVGLARDSGGVERVVYSRWLEKTAGGAASEEGVQISRGGGVDRAAKEWDEEKRLFADTRFKRGAEAARLLPGTWAQVGGHTWVTFNADGTYGKSGLFEEKGTYRMTGPADLETHRPDPSRPDGFTGRYQVLAGEDEMHLFMILSPLVHPHDGPYYRILPEGGNAGQKLVVDPLAKTLREGNPQEKAGAAGALGRLGPGAAPALPALLAALEDENELVRVAACRAVGHVGPAAKEAVPRLIKLLDDPRVALWACVGLGGIGPEAREALPHLRATAQKGLGGVSTQAEAAIKLIER